MSDRAGEEDLSVSEQAGVRVVRVLANTGAAPPPDLKDRLQRLVADSTGIVLDCRELPSGAFEWIAPLLYEMMLVGRQQSPRVEVSAVGRLDQTIGGGGAFLLPPRFETLEAASAAVGMKRAGAIQTLSRGQASEKPMYLGRTAGQSRFWDSWAAQALLTIMVLGATFGLIAWSASISFSQVTTPRRIGTADTSERIVVHGRVQCFEGRTVSPDTGAVLLVWPTGHSSGRFAVQKPASLDLAWQANHTALRIFPVSELGTYSVTAGQLPERATLYHVLAISGQVQRKQPISSDDEKLLSAFFEKPNDLIGDREFVLRSIFLDANVAKDLDFSLTRQPSSPGEVSSVKPAGG